MAEKVIFELRVRREKDGYGFEVRHGEDHFTLLGLDIGPCCPLGDMPGESNRQQRDRDKVRHQMRETLDFFEQMYDDLFGEQVSDEG